MSSERPSRRRVELRVRERAPAPVIETIDEVVTRLRRLEDDGRLVDLRVETWGGARSLEIPGSPVVDVVETFRDWATEAGYTLEPAFDRRERSSIVSETTHTELVVPYVTVAVYDGVELECVAPCSKSDDVFTVHDCLTALEASTANLLEAIDPGPVDDGERVEREPSPA